ncbi:hypothetical protein BDV12DRAFT_205273 [Aspergillus spectabilis]
MPLSCQLLCNTFTQITPSVVDSYKHFIQVQLLKDLNPDIYRVQESDDLRLALYIQSTVHLIYLPYSSDEKRSTSQILQQYQENNKKGIFVIIIQDIVEPIPTEPEKGIKKTRKKKGAAKPRSSVREPDMKQEPDVEQEAVIRELNIKQEPAIQSISRKRCFSVALKEVDIKLGLEKQEEKEDSDTIFEALSVPTEDDSIAYRTRKRHTIQPENIERSAKFGIQN